MATMSADGDPVLGPIDKQLESELFETGTDRGINFDKYDEIPVQYPRNKAQHKQFDRIKLYSDFNLHQWILQNAGLSGYKKPTPVQKHGIPSLLLDWDLMACAQTGSGKTATYLLPIISNMITQGPQPFRRGVKDWELLEDRHNRSQQLHRGNITIIERGHFPVWRVQSGTNSEESYKVSLEDECCSCVVRCRQCGVCANMYLCTCPDFIHREVACKHIHLVHTEFGCIGVDPLALILAPTRELAMQIHKETQKFSYRTAITSAVIYGGRKYLEQIDQLMYGCDILVATPGRLLDAIRRGHLALNNCRFLVLDEADKMLDMGFEPQIRKVVRYLPVAGDRQTVMFSATFPKDIQELARDFLVKDYDSFAVGRIGSTTENITQNVVWVEESEKPKLLVDLLEEIKTGSLTLVFLKTKLRTAHLTNELIAAGFNVVTLHSDIGQKEREDNLDKFRKGIAPILCATDVAARGLDIPHVDVVINYDLPAFRRSNRDVQAIDQYVHRIGRTGRAGNKGEAIALFTEHDIHIAPDLADLMTEAQQEMPEWLIKHHKPGKQKQKFTGFFAARGGNSKPKENEWGEREE